MGEIDAADVGGVYVAVVLFDLLQVVAWWRLLAGS